METAAFPQRVIMRALRTDHEHLATIAGQLRAAGRRPTITTIMRHALQVAAGAVITQQGTHHVDE